MSFSSVSSSFIVAGEFVIVYKNLSCFILVKREKSKSWKIGVYLFSIIIMYQL